MENKKCDVKHNVKATVTFTQQYDVKYLFAFLKQNNHNKKKYLNNNIFYYIRTARISFFQNEVV